MYLDGNAYALALCNDRFEASELHLMNPRMSSPMVAETGDVFYRLAGNDVIDRQLSGEQLIVPMRDVLHIRLHSDRRVISRLDHARERTDLQRQRATTSAAVVHDLVTHFVSSCQGNNTLAGRNLFFYQRS